MTDTPQPKKLNLLLLTTELRPGGAEKCLVQLAINLDPELFKVIIVTLGSKPSSSEDRWKAQGPTTLHQLLQLPIRRGSLANFESWHSPPESGIHPSTLLRGRKPPGPGQSL